MRSERRSSITRKSRRVLLPTGVFLLVLVVHYIWLVFFPEGDTAQSRWVTVSAAESTSSFKRYIETQSHWLGISYGMSLTFAVAALRRYRERRFCAARNLAIGGVTLSGFLAVAGCYLLGCCGSPMLVVYLNLFGAAFLPLAKPLMALITAVSLAGAWWWLRQHERKIAVIAEDQRVSSHDHPHPVGGGDWWKT
ncbi:MAG: hypothetical protein JSW71_07285 [Gemmatimonadota bacterium]|nr:MAG: hypothetical protein JSW71_07285 [Gemmatimonadota bacterium]